VDHSQISAAFADSAAAEDTVRAATTPWIVLRPTLLSGARPRWQPLGRTAGLGTSISRAALAQAILDVAGDHRSYSSPLSITGS